MASCGNWEAISALATLGATAVALFSSAAALWAPGRDAARQRRESTDEILRATDGAIGLFERTRSLVEGGASWTDKDLGKLQAQAIYARRALEQLIQRPSLTDGAIFTGAGAIALLDLVLAVKPERDLASDAFKAASARDFQGAVFVDARASAHQAIDQGADVVEVTKERAERVRQYMREKWLDRTLRHARRAATKGAP